MDQVPDEDLFERFRRGERAAFETLLGRHRAALFTFVVRTLGDDRARAEDLVQETFLRVIQGARDWERRARFSTWLYTIARNLCFDAKRRDRHRRTESLDQPHGSADGEEVGRPWVDLVAGSSPGPERLANAARVRPVLVAALEKLPEEQREVFVLREQAGLPFKEIANVTRTSENTVKSRMRYALESLRKSLAAAGVDGDLADLDAAQPRAPTGTG